MVGLFAPFMSDLETSDILTHGFMNEVKFLEIETHYQTIWIEKHQRALSMEAQERAGMVKLGRKILRTFRARHPDASRTMQLEYMERAADPPRRRIAGKQQPAVLAR